MKDKEKLLSLIVLITIPLLLILFLIDNVIIKNLIDNKIDQYKSNIIKERKKQLIKDVNLIKQSISIYYEKNKLKSKPKEELIIHKKELLDYINHMSTDLNNYYWVTDINLNIIMHPFNKNYLYKNIEDISKNFNITIPLSELKTNKHSIIEYSLISNSNTTSDKLGAVMLFKPFGWAIIKSVENLKIDNEFEVLKNNFISDYKYVIGLLFIFFFIFVFLLIYFIYKFSSKSIFEPIEKDIKKLNDELIEKNKELEKTFYIDELTKLNNLFALKRDIKDLDITCLFLIDIDSFDNINKLYGYRIGDKILIKYANILKSFAKKNSYNVYRIYSNTFALQGKKEDFKVESFYREILDLINNYTSLKIKKDYEKDLNLNVDLDINVGVCLYQDNIITKANTALKEAKRNSKRLYIYNGEINEKYKIEKYIDIKKIVENAIIDNTIIPFFQPIVDRKKEIVKYESLMRIEQNGNILTPYNFMDIAIKTKLYNKISMIMIEKSIKKAEKYNKSISINLSTTDLLNNDFINMLNKYLNKKNVNLCKLITFEILEDQNIDDFDYINKFLMPYRKLGVTIAIDDFGTGYSNFLNILKMKPDYIKIDGSLIKNIVSDKNSFEVVKSIISFSKTLEITTIAEFIHNEEVFITCKGLGIDRFQGYYFYKPQENFKGMF